MPNVYDFSATTITGKEVAIADYKDKVLLWSIPPVNVV